MNAKSPLLSKTLWVNGLTVAITVLTALSGLADIIPPRAMAILVALLGVANLALRVVTKAPLDLGGSGGSGGDKLLALLLIAGLALPTAAGCKFQVCPDEPQKPRPVRAKPAPSVPVVNIPRDLREWNWGGGSCVHASTVMHLRWQHRPDIASFWRKTYSGGESYSGLTGKLNRNGIPFYATAGGGGDDIAGASLDHLAFMRWLTRQGHSFYYTTRGDASVLERCTLDRRGGVIFYYPNHSILFCGFTRFEGGTFAPEQEYAIVLDNNRIENFIPIPKADFLRKWRGYGGVCVVPTIGEPPPPTPWIPDAQFALTP